VLERIGGMVRLTLLFSFILSNGNAYSSLFFGKKIYQIITLNSSTLLFIFEAPTLAVAINHI
jgi:hypothetical protein